MSDITQVEIQILGRRFTIGTPAAESARLEEAVRLLNEKIGAIQQFGQISENEKVLIMAALNLTHDFLQKEEEGVKAGAPGSASATEVRGWENRIRFLNQLCQETLDAP